jgi:hypothetical protein
MALNRIQSSKFKDLKEKLDQKGSSNYKKDERFWVITKTAGKGDATVRILPNLNDEELPWFTMYKHSIDINKNLFIDKCPTTIGEECPICDWNSTQDKDWIRETTKSYRKKSYIVNILVIDDKDKPENNGKVFLFEFGTQLYNVIKEAMSEASEEDRNPFLWDPDEGCNLKLKLRPDTQYPTWVNSKFASPTLLKNELDKFNLNEDKLEKMMFNLTSLANKEDFKTSEILKGKFDKYAIKTGLINGELMTSSKPSNDEKNYVDKTKKVTIDDEEDDVPFPVKKESKPIDKKMAKASEFMKKFQDEDDD